MVLSSQRNRGGPGRLYSTGRKKHGSSRGHNRAWIGLVLAAIALVVGYRWLVAGDQPQGNVQSAEAATVTEPDVQRPRDADTTLRGPTFASPPSRQAAALADAPRQEPSSGLPTASRERESAPPVMTFDSLEQPAPPSTSSPAVKPAANPQPAAALQTAPRLGQVPVGAITSSPDTSAATRLREGMALVEQGQPVKARVLLSSLLFDPRHALSPRDAQATRDVLASINQSLVFSDRVSPGDPLAEAYTVQSGDMLVRIAPRYHITYQFIETVNHVDAHRLRVGQKLKLIKGPFHAIVHKSAFRMDVYLNDRDGQRIYVRSFPVGLGENDSTPIGRWRVRPSSKLQNPGWTHPRTNVYYAPDNIENPIGEYWLGLEGTDDNTRGRNGYGIHGTIEPDSVGRMMSLGCIRLLPDDIAMIFQLFVEEDSTVEVRP